jgi:hypothetical protein
MATEKIYNSDDNLPEEVAKRVYGKISETFTDFMTNIETGQKNIASSISKIAEDVNDIKLRLSKNEDRVEAEETEIENIKTRLESKKTAIKQLRDDYERNKEHLEYVASIKPTLQTLQNMFNFWTWENWWKIALIIIGILFIFSVLNVKLNVIMHDRGVVTSTKKPVQSYEYNQSYERDIQIRMAPVRGDDEISLSIPRSDSVISENQRGIENGIEERRLEYEAKFGKKQ